MLFCLFRKSLCIFSANPNTSLPLPTSSAITSRVNQSHIHLLVFKRSIALSLCHTISQSHSGKMCVCMCACACFLSGSRGCLSYNQPVPSLSDWAVLPLPCSVRVTSHCKGGCNMGVSYMLRERKKMIDFGKD